MALRKPFEESGGIHGIGIYHAFLFSQRGFSTSTEKRFPAEPEKLETHHGLHPLLPQ
jgi:hypothetical protein